MADAPHTANEEPASETIQFLERAFGGLPDAGAYGYLWTLPGKLTRWFGTHDLQETTAFALSEAEAGRDVYVGVGVGSSDFGPHRRVHAQGEHAAAGIVAFVADVDFAANGKPGYPPDADAAHSLLAECGLEPTVTVGSGGGLHAWWLFSEPWMFDSEDEREDAIALSAGWQNNLRRLSRARGWTIDSVGDIARVLRLPGTVNFKQRDNPRPVRVVKSAWFTTYTRYDFDAWRDCAPVNGATLVVPDLGDLSDCAMPWEIHAAAMENVEGYRECWTKTSKHLLGKSQSEWDLAMVARARDLMTDDRQLAALLGEYRRKHCTGDEAAKGSRPDYIARTIGKARERTVEEAARRDADEYIHLHDPEEVAPNDGVQKVADLFAIPLKRVQLVSGKTPVFRFYVGDDTVEIPAAELALSQERFSKAVYAACGVTLRKLTKDTATTWAVVARLLWSCAEKVDAGVDSSLDGEFMAWVSEFVGPDAPACPFGEAIPANRPFVRDGRVWFSRQRLLQFLGHNGVKITVAELGQKLASVGAVRRTYATTTRGKATSISLHGVTAEFRQRHWQGAVTEHSLSGGENEIELESGSIS